MPATAPPPRVDRIIVHQFDPARPSPGGIDSCLRGICRYLPAGLDVAVVGVDTGADREGRRLGSWERYELEDDRRLWFLPVVALDPGDQSRRVPHALRLVAGIVRHRNKIPRADVVQVHRMDTALALRRILPSPQAYFIHTQENGLTGQTSDSFWRFSAGAHARLERHVVTRAKSVVVFNREYSALVQQFNPRAVFSPTWFDPRLIRGEQPARNPYRILWVGRLEKPKDPVLAIDAFAALVRADPRPPWSLEIVGSGTLTESVRDRVASLPGDVAGRISVAGRLSPEDVAAAMADAGIFLMTSHAGYEGFPRVLVEAMASGLPAVVTEGSDTGGLVEADRTGFVCGRQPQDLAGRLLQARTLDRDLVRSAVGELSAPVLVQRILALDHPPRTAPTAETDSELVETEGVVS